MSHATKPIRILKSTSSNPFVNLATEYYLFNQRSVQVPTLYLWMNEPCIVIGKNQNPWKECHVNKMEMENIHMVRRHSGGGAVYHDFGNSIYTFLMPKHAYDKQKNFAVIQNALKKDYGIDVSVSGRNDLTVNNRKISGSAFKELKDRALHHGTILRDLNLNALQKYLTPHKLKLQSKGVDSVVSRVQNLKEIVPEITHEKLCDRLIEEFITTFGVGDRVDIENVRLQEMESNPEWRKEYELLMNWEFRFAKTPEFTYNFETRFNWGLLDVHIDSKAGQVTDIKIFTDSLYPIIVDDFSRALKGKPLRGEEIMNAAEQVALAVRMSEDYDTETKKHIEACCFEMANWIRQSL